MKAILYARFSSDIQKEGDSIARQTKLGKAFINNNDWTLDKIITDAAKSAFSGRNRQEGSALHQFESEAAAGQHRGAVLVVENLDRLSRRGPRETATLVWNLNQNGVTVATFQDGYIHRPDANDDIVGLITMVIKSQMSQEESLNKQKRTNANWERRYAAIRANDHANVFAGRMPPWLVRNRNGTYSFNDHRVDIMKWIFEQTIAGVGAYTMAIKLNERKEPVWSRLKKHAKAGWNQSQITKLQKNRAVLGEYWAGDELLSSDFFPAILTVAEFEKAKAAKRSRRTTGGSAGRTFHVNLMSGIVYCDNCNERMAFERKVSHQKKADGTPVIYQTRTFKCRDNVRSFGCDHNQRFKYTVVEKAVLDSVLSEIIEEQRPDSDFHSLREQIDARVAELKKAKMIIDNIVDVIAEGQFSPALSERLAGTEQQAELLKKNIAALEEQMQTERAKPAKSVDQETIRKMLADIESDDPDIKLKTRSTINKSLRRIVPVISFSKSGRFAFVVAGGKGAYVFDKDGNCLSSPQRRPV